MRARFERELPGTLAHVVSLARRGSGAVSAARCTG